MVKNATRELGIDLHDIDGFAVARGPGSFSGIRVGMATIKGVALALDKPVVGISSLEILAWQALEEGELGFTAIDARREEIYMALYMKENDRVNLLQGPLVMKLEEFHLVSDQFRDRAVLCADPSVCDSPQINPALVRRPVPTPSAVACARLALERFRARQADSIHGLTPLYIRRPDAEEKRRLR
jgi:tRNA threonylcarbamoyl adenosine modification protein YeaZ